MKKKEPVVRVIHYYISYYQNNALQGEGFKQLNFRLKSLSFLKSQLQKKE